MAPMPPDALRSVPGYRHLPGHHCGSTAIRNVLGFHGIELTEEMAFGLGAGPCFYYLVLDEGSPTRFTNGRTSRLEERFLEFAELPLRLEKFDTADASWSAARTAIDSGQPVLLLTDLFYLDHYGRSAHFPGHAVVLVGYDDDGALLSDTDFAELQRTSLASLAQARHADHPVYELAGDMISLDPDAPRGDPAAGVDRAIAATAARMLEPQLGEFEGLPALRRFAGEVGDWRDGAPDWQWCARFNYQAIERRGTGGGNFRLMYSRFLSEVGYVDCSRLAAAAAAAWTRLAEELRAASDSDGAGDDRWPGIADLAERVLESEEGLWSALARIGA